MTQQGETFDWAAALASDEGRAYAHAAEQFLDDAANAEGLGATEQALIGIGYALLAVQAHTEASSDDLPDAALTPRRRPWWRRLVDRPMRPVDQGHAAEVIEGPWADLPGMGARS